ncbi:tRNA 2-thiouridine(34) synthase MnmA [Candidatus Bipolaricaulota bacterium]|nr:tRNA 2-thiouridine(34) synthase MnmA [Candidatus Bipolaricaulota bacterium]
MSKTPRVVVCLSGGVDSAVAAHLLRDRGYDVSAITFWFWSFAGAPDYAGATKCCSLDTAALAARELDIPHKEIDASDAFEKLVLEDFVARYRRGETPNPCGRCNRHLRFGLALRHAEEHGFDYVATGHHVRLLKEPDGSYSLRRGRDANKDQTYFLYGLRQADLSRLLFPVGDLTKDDVFAIAKEAGLSAAELPESQDLCFAVDGETSFLFDEADLRPGPILATDGRELGTHRGLPRYTIGQRRGLGVTSKRPMFVIDVDFERNALIVGREADLTATGLTAADASFLTPEPPEDGIRVGAKIRYRSTATTATFHRMPEDRFALCFDGPQRAVTPGQLAVLYDGDRLLGGGTIVRHTACQDSSLSV